MDAAKAMTNIRILDEIHLQDTMLTRRHPFAHGVVTLAFIIIVLSGGKYEISGLLCFAFYPLAMLILGDLPLGIIGRRILYVLPLIVLIGIWNPLLDKGQIAFGNLLLSAGWFSFFSMLIRCVLTVAAALILICLTGMNGIAQALRTAHVPQILVAVLSFTYRYIHVLGEEVIHLLTAYKLRAPRQKGVALKNFGAMCGGLFLRSMRRADQIYIAMRCRGFQGDMPPSHQRRFNVTDGCYLLGWLLYFVLMRLYNLPLALGNLFVRAGS